MKNFFKYNNGYVNIDEDNLFLTNSGNWSETNDIQEKSTKTEKENNYKNFKYKFFLFVLGLLVCFVLYKSFDNLKNKILPLGLIVLFISVYRYFKNETGKKIKIPLEKIASIEFFENDVKINFYNSLNILDSEYLKKIDTKGFDILKSLKY